MKNYIVKHPKDLEQIRARRKAKNRMLLEVNPLVRSNKEKTIEKRKRLKRKRSKKRASNNS